MTMTVEGLDDAWMYEFRIKCANLIGESEPSIPLTVVIQDDEGKAEMNILDLLAASEYFSLLPDLSRSCCVPFSGP